MPLLDTTQYKDLLGSFISDLILQVLSFVAEQERNNIRKRQAEGIATAKAQGKHLGRPQLDINKELFENVYKEWKNGEITGVQAMNKANMKKTTFYKNVKEYEKRKEKIK